MGDWTEEAKKAINLCEQWACAVVHDIVGAQVFLFGSSIYKGGEQFDPDSSDLDIIILLEKSMGLMERVEALKVIYKHKGDLELEMVRTLHRSSCTEPGVSIVPITDFELRTNIHKSGARSFLDKNFFYDLITRKQSLGLPMSGTLSLPDENRYAIEYVQQTRNRYLSVCANGTGGLKEYLGTDPMPKALLRFAAQLVTDVEVGEWYDTRIGLEAMFSRLSDRRREDDAIDKLFSKVSILRKGRGHIRPLTADDQLLLAELLFDVAKQVDTEGVVTWEIRITGASLVEDLVRITDNLKRFVPDARIVQIRQGSVILVIRSARRGYLTLQRLSEQGVLAELLEVEDCVLGQINEHKGSDSAGFRNQDLQTLLVDRLSSWTPSRGSSPKQYEDELGAFLLEMVASQQQFSHVRVLRHVKVPNAALGRYELDFEIRWISDAQQNEIAIELKVLRTVSNFFDTMQRLLALRRSIVLVALATRDIATELQADISQFSEVSRQVQIVLVRIND
ncbi:hypothetical protein [Caballeronia sp. SBC2]|uniref:hypothetical protein n=1 Tax=Caballeronia sp. SBC2 TaxID=2705547 RepID=UPI0013E1A89F|nr:hypothetical protein [Caballeronia sp. SBC2]QIE22134.1 hypothetical protein SBC2_01430 [Caballeronia sp. SBC2]